MKNSAIPKKVLKSDLTQKNRKHRRNLLNCAKPETQKNWSRNILKSHLTKKNWKLPLILLKSEKFCNTEKSLKIGFDPKKTENIGEIFWIVQNPKPKKTETEIFLNRIWPKKTEYFGQFFGTNRHEPARKTQLLPFIFEKTKKRAKKRLLKKSIDFFCNWLFLQLTFFGFVPVRAGSYRFVVLNWK